MKIIRYSQGWFRLEQSADGQALALTNEKTNEQIIALNGEARILMRELQVWELIAPEQPVYRTLWELWHARRERAETLELT